MGIVDIRDVMSFPTGDNATDTIIGDVHFNLTTLKFWNYTLFSNNTLSNGSWCILAFQPYTPSSVIANGTFNNVTWCYTPVKPIGLRAGIGIGFAVAFGLTLVFSMLCLAKHGKLYLPVEQRFRPIGRRWQWYWTSITCGAALVSLIVNVDVDRYYLPELPIVINVFFWYLMQMAAMAAVWEMVRHWGSWMERQFIDPNPFALRTDDRRSKVEFWLPLFFYFWFWMNFFLIVPRNWGRIELQRYPEQIIEEAIPGATDGRFKAAAFCLFICWLITVFSLRHSIKHYCEHNRGIFNRAVGLIRFTPFRFQLILLLALAIPGYQALAAWEFQWSPSNVSGLNVAIYAGGYAPTLLILLINILSGFSRPNEDRELLRQRRIRGDAIDRELGIVKKPAWWRRLHGENGQPERMRDRIARNVRELGGGRATASHLEQTIPVARGGDADATASGGARPRGDDVEMTPMNHINTHAGLIQQGDFASARALADKYAGKSERRRTERTMQTAASMLFPNSEASAAAAAARRADLMTDGPPPPSYTEVERGRSRNSPGAGNGRSNSTGTTNSIGAPPQQVRSMLDV